MNWFEILGGMAVGVVIFMPFAVIIYARGHEDGYQDGYEDGYKKATDIWTGD
jgi:hypothetical protein